MGGLYKLLHFSFVLRCENLHLPIKLLFMCSLVSLLFNDDLLAEMLLCIHLAQTQPLEKRISIFFRFKVSLQGSTLSVIYFCLLIYLHQLFWWSTIFSLLLILRNASFLCFLLGCPQQLLNVNTWLLNIAFFVFILTLISFSGQLILYLDQLEADVVLDCFNLGGQVFDVEVCWQYMILRAQSIHFSNGSN